MCWCVDGMGGCGTNLKVSTWGESPEKGDGDGAPAAGPAVRWYRPARIGWR